MFYKLSNLVEPYCDTAPVVEYVFAQNCIKLAIREEVFYPYICLLIR